MVTLLTVVPDPTAVDRAVGEVVLAAGKQGRDTETGDSGIANVTGFLRGLSALTRRCVRRPVGMFLYLSSVAPGTRECRVSAYSAHDSEEKTALFRLVTVWFSTAGACQVFGETFRKSIVDGHGAGTPHRISASTATTPLPRGRTRTGLTSISSK